MNATLGPRAARHLNPALKQQAVAAPAKVTINRGVDERPTMQHEDACAWCVPWLIYMYWRSHHQAGLHECQMGAAAIRRVVRLDLQASIPCADEHTSRTINRMNV